jgi:tRNA threonylcarbamoyladenosine biosynthesis protein TsaE
MTGTTAYTVTYTLDELEQTAEQLLKHSRSPYILFDAPMGAGKTTLIREIIKKISPQEFLGSPTFALVNEYLTHEGDPFYHFDLYRIKSPEELLDIGFEEYLQQASWIFIEWPERARELMPEKHTLVRIEPVDGQTRTLQILNK